MLNMESYEVSYDIGGAPGIQVLYDLVFGNNFIFVIKIYVD